MTRAPSPALQALLDTDDLPKTEVQIPEWGLGGEGQPKAFIRTMSGAERDAYEASNLRPGEGGKLQVTFENISARLVARCLVDAEGQRIVPDEHIDKLGKKSAKVLNRLYRVAQQVNGLNPGAADAAEKNS